ncbi:MAG TPA: NUDIX pyrophosphatase [Longimicrobium sp.]|jgi:dATP pyrophosphohydrolase|uniref:NUDIX hydrolase n=1 Tax=Longimicrobium sp. TaxID=2029185 RepID=UPI002ED9BEF6
MRAPFQVLVLLYTWTVDGKPRYAVLRRADLGVWQPVAGGGEDEETPAQAAGREAWEEAGLPLGTELISLGVVGRVPVTEFRDRAHWPPHLETIPEHAFAAPISPAALRLSAEHDAIEWMDYASAAARLHWPSNRAALAALHQRLTSSPPA